MKAKEKAGELLKKYKIFLNYDSIADLSWKSPNDKARQDRVRKDAVRLSILCVDEVLSSLSYTSSLLILSNVDLKELAKYVQFYHEVKEELKKL